MFFRNITNKFYVNILPSILIVYFVAIDLINGYLQNLLDLHTPIGIISRGIILLITIHFLFKNKQSDVVKLFLFILLIYILIIPFWFLNNQGFVLSIELEMLFKFLYFFSIFSYFYSYRHFFSIKTLLSKFVLSAFLIAITNIFCFLFGIGVKTYGDSFGFGIKSFYADGNSLSLYMILVNCLSIWYAFYSSFKMIFVSIIISVGTILVGTRAAFIGVVVSWSSILLYLMLYKDPFICISKKTRFFMGFSIGGMMGYGLYLAYLFISRYDYYTLERFSIDAVIVPREKLIFFAKQLIDEFNFREFLFGKSYSGAINAVGYLSNMTVSSKSIEADFYDTILSFGWIFGGLMIILQLLIFKGLFMSFIRNKSSLSFSLLLVGCLWIGASYMAGHGFNNTMLAPLLSVCYVINCKLSNI